MGTFASWAIWGLVVVLIFAVDYGMVCSVSDFFIELFDGCLKHKWLLIPLILGLVAGIYYIIFGIKWVIGGIAFIVSAKAFWIAVESLFVIALVVVSLIKYKKRNQAKNARQVPKKVIPDNSSNSVVFKHPNSKIIIPAANGNDHALAEWENELNKFEKEVDMLTLDLSRIDSSIDEFRKSCNEIAEKIADFGTSVIDSLSSDNSNKAKGVVGVAALAVKGYGYLAGQKKEKAAKQEYEKQLAVTLDEKRRVADEKIPHVQQQLAKWKSGNGTLCESIYDNEFKTTSNLDDKELEIKIRMFRRMLCCVIKSRYLTHLLEYCIAEMEAWQEGWQDTTKVKAPDMAQELAFEIGSWAGKLNINGPLNEHIAKALKQSKGQITIPIATLLADPCLFRNFVGINFGETGNCVNAIINLPDNNNVCNPLVLNNNYYKHCLDILQNQYRPPKKPSEFNILDILVLLVIPAVFFGMLVLIFKVESSVGWRIFFMIPALCWIGFGIEYLETNFDKIFPYAERISDYNSRNKQFRDSIIMAEDCQEIHTLK